MNLSTKRTALIGALFVAAFFVSFGYAAAQVSVSLYPVSFRYDIPRGGAQNGTVTVSNPSATPLTLQIELENFQGGEGGTVEYAPDGHKYGLISWIEVDKTPFVLQPGQKKELPFTVRVPDNGEVGGHYGAIIFRAASGENTGGGSQLGISGRVGSIILVSVPGNVRKGGELTNLSVPGFLQYGPLTAAATFKNTGSVHYVTKGTATFKGIFGSRTVDFEGRTVLPEVANETKATLDKTWLVGPIQTSVQMVAGDGSVSTAKAWSFALPIIPTIVIILLVIVGSFLIKFLKKKFKIVRVPGK